MKNNTLRYILLAILTVIAILLRTFFKLGPNIELITSLGLLAGFLLPKIRISLFFPLIAMLVSDLLIGNTYIFLFTWTGFLVPVLLGSRILRKMNLQDKIFKQMLSASAVGLISVVFFYLWTNLGVVLISGMYEISFNGLINSYINALPFLKMQLAANLVFIPATFLASAIILNHKSIRSLNQYFK